MRVYDPDKNTLQQLYQQLDVWAYDPEQGFATVYLDSQTQLQKLLAYGLPVRTDSAMLRNWQQGLQAINTPHRGSGIPGFSCYGTVAETFQRMDQMVADHPDLAAIIDIGDSWEKQNLAGAGSDLKILSLTNQNLPGDKPVLFLASAIHAREYTTAELNTRFAEHLLAEYGQRCGCHLDPRSPRNSIVAADQSRWPPTGRNRHPVAQEHQPKLLCTQQQ